MKTSHKIFPLLCLLLAATSGIRSAQQPSQSQPRATSTTSIAPDTLAPDLPLPAIPATLRTPHERASYLLAHFWDGMSFADTLRSRNSDFMEQNLVNYLSLFPHAPAEARTQAVHLLMQRAETDKPAYLLLAELAEKYLYTTGSPMQSEEHFIPFLEETARTPLLDETEKSRPRFLLAAALKNRPGTTAADFTYHTPEGNLQTLHATPSAPRLLLMFYNPDCTHCRQAIALLHDDGLFKQMLHDGRLTVLAINTENDHESPTRHEARPRSGNELPDGWTAGTATPTLADDEPYILPSMPVLYLLDQEKHVLLKEALPEQVLARLAEESRNHPRPKE